MPYDVQDTIAAIATPSAPAARGVVRMSGTVALDIAHGIFRPASGEPSLESLRVPSSVDGHLKLLDPLGEVEASLLLWPTERSYTRQVTVEIHTLGSQPILQATLARLVELGARLAEPGEFTLRAFLAGRLDLTQAEAVLGVIDAPDQQALNSALGQLAGGLAVPLAELREQLLTLLAHLEAGLDFVEEDIEFISADDLQQKLTVVATSVRRLAAQMDSRETTDAPPKVAILGWPNVGKSSLFNALTQHDSALVSPTAGATRDYVSARIEAAPQAYELIDTAGISNAVSLHEIDRSAQTVTKQQVSAADLQILCLDSTRTLNSWERQTLEQTSANRIVVLTKCDRPAREPTLDLAIDIEAKRVSSNNGAGIAELRTAIAQLLIDGDVPSATVAGTAMRCRESLLRAAESLTRALEISQDSMGDELVATELRLALEEIGRVAGAVYTDDLLDQIFSRFCIGK